MTEIECTVEGCNHTFTSAQGLKSHFAFTHGLPSYQTEYEETKERIEAAKENTSDGKYPENWDEIRRKVFVRDDHQCQRCGTKRGESELHAHHQTPISKGGGHDLDNLITLCQGCHSKEHGRPIGTNASAQKNQFQKGGDDIL